MTLDQQAAHATMTSGYNHGRHENTGLPWALCGMTAAGVDQFLASVGALGAGTGAACVKNKATENVPPHYAMRRLV